MYVGGLCTNLDDPPTSSMFNRAGGKGPAKGSTTLSGALTQMSEAICCLAPKPLPISAVTVPSPVKCIDSRFKCQLSEISNLKQTGVLSEEEFAVEKAAIMKLLKKL